MVSVLVSKTLRAAAALTFAAAILMAGLAGPASAGVIYDYVGNDFTSVTPPFTTNDSIIGFVEFGSQPAPGDTGVTDVIAFSFTAGSFTVTSETIGVVVGEILFDFDSTSPQPGIAGWVFEVGELALPITLFISCTSGFGECGGGQAVDVITLDIDFVVSGLVLDTPGTWTKRAALVPEPGTLWLLLTGLAALVLGQALSRRQGRPARA